MIEGITYRYFVLGSMVPVRVTLAAFGLKRGTERPDPKTGRLVFDHALLLRLEQSHEVEEIDETEFHRRCREIFEQGRA